MIVDMIYLMIIFFCLLLIGFFSGVETGIISLNRIKIKHLARENNFNAKLVNSMMESPHKILGTTLVGTNLFVILASALFTAVLFDLFGEGNEMITTLILTPFVLIFSEIIPKNLFRSKADLFIPKCAVPMFISMKIFYPVVAVVNFFAKIILSPFLSSSMTMKNLFVSREELKYFIKESERAGIIEPTKRAMVYNIFDFGKKKISEVMVSFKKVTSLDVSCTVDDCIEISKKTMYVRIPIFEQQENNVIGFINVFDILYKNKAEQKKISIRQLIRPVYYIKKEMLIDNVFFTMRIRRLQVAIVIDKFHRAEGMVTIKDLLDEVIGET